CRKRLADEARGIFVPSIIPSPFTRRPIGRRPGNRNRGGPAHARLSMPMSDNQDLTDTSYDPVSHNQMAVFPLQATSENYYSCSTLVCPESYDEYDLEVSQLPMPDKVKCNLTINGQYSRRPGSDLSFNGDSGSTGHMTYR